MSRRYCIAWFVISLPAGKRITILPWKTDSCHFFPRLKFDLYIWKKSVSRYLCNTHSATCCLNKKADFEVDFDDEWTCPLKAKQSMAVMEININLIVQVAKIRFFMWLSIIFILFVNSKIWKMRSTSWTVFLQFVLTYWSYFRIYSKIA